MFDDFIKKLGKDYNISYDVDAQNFGVFNQEKDYLFGQIKTLNKKINIFENLKNLKIKKICIRSDIRSTLHYG